MLLMFIIIGRFENLISISKHKPRQKALVNRRRLIWDKNDCNIRRFSAGFFLRGALHVGKTHEKSEDRCD